MRCEHKACIFVLVTCYQKCCEKTIVYNTFVARIHIVCSLWKQSTEVKQKYCSFHWHTKCCRGQIYSAFEECEEWWIKHLFYVYLRDVSPVKLYIYWLCYSFHQLFLSNIYSMHKKTIRSAVSIYWKPCSMHNIDGLHQHQFKIDRWYQISVDKYNIQENGSYHSSGACRDLSSIPSVYHAAQLPVTILAYLWVSKSFMFKS